MNKYNSIGDIEHYFDNNDYGYGLNNELIRLNSKIYTTDSTTEYYDKNRYDIIYSILKKNEPINKHISFVQKDITIIDESNELCKNAILIREYFLTYKHIKSIYIIHRFDYDSTYIDDKAITNFNKINIITSENVKTENLSKNILIYFDGILVDSIPNIK